MPIDAVDVWKNAIAWLNGLQQGRGLGGASAFAAAVSGFRFVENTDWQAATMRVMCLILALMGIIQWAFIIFGQSRCPAKKPITASRKATQNTGN